MGNYTYVPKKIYKPTKLKLIALINTVQRYLRHKFTFRVTFDFRFVGSSRRNMITMNPKSNVGYDFDLDLRIYARKKVLTPSEYKHMLMDAFNKFVHEYGYDYCEDNARVFTIKHKDEIKPKIIHSCDFAIVRDCDDGRLEYIRHHREHNTYFWEKQSIYPAELTKQVKFCKYYNLWNKVRSLYIKLKNENTDPNVKSRSIYSQTVNQIYLKNIS